jgi:hypothetical protein
MNIDILGLEVRTYGHFVFFAAVGSTTVFGPGFNFSSGDCQEVSQGCGPNENTFPQVRTGVGGWF